MKRHGFTLIELLVVIAIIAILAAILFPVFARARAKAQQNSCLANIKQLALGVLMYNSDHDTRCPYAWSTAPPKPMWSGSVYPYVRNVQIYACPSTNTAAALSGPPNPWGGDVPWVVPTSYRLNPCLGALGAGAGCYVFPGNTNHCGRGDSWGPGVPLKEEDILRPAEMIMLYETIPEDPGSSYGANPDRAINCYLSGDKFDITWGGPNGYTPSYFATRMAQRHNEGSNVGYTDGHAKWLSRNAAYTADARFGWSNVS